MLSALLMTAALAADPHSYANLDEVRVRHAELDLRVDFEQRRLEGFVELTLDRSASRLLLDTRDLDIDKAYAIVAGEYRKIPAQLSTRDPIFGQKLSLALPVDTQRVRIYYRTRPEASGLQWLEPALTAGKVQPFLFSQSQAIHARSWLPIQDSPAVRFTYGARIRTPKGLLARMSAENDSTDVADGDYRFVMRQPIPSYLLAIAVGDLKFAPLGARSGIYAEPSMLEAAAHEFADTERMIDLTESLYGPYRWGRYDLLVLPPSFPFGGMENPRLTFLTPTVIAGDRSLVSLIAHELAHSWSGNLVTNATWDHFWLNEGFTTYVENRIIEAAFDAERAAMERELSESGLDGELLDLKPADQHLRLDLRGRDPDDGMTEVAYTKGMLLLRFLETRFGRERFDPFLRDWFDKHAFGAVTTDDFLAFTEEQLLARNPGIATREEMLAFIDRPGVPGNTPRTQAARFVAVDQARNRWLRDGEAETLSTEQWTTQEWLRFIEGLPTDIPGARLAALDERFALSQSGNSEIAFAWYQKAIEADYRAAFPAIEAFLTRVGRRKFVLPLFTALAAKDAAFARQVYAKARPGYHPITRASVDAVVPAGR